MKAFRPNVLLAALLAASGVASDAVAQPAAAARKPDVRAGKELYVKTGCYQCHGYSGQGAVTGPRLAPNTIPHEAFAMIVRNPPSAMPPYGRRVLTDAQLADIHAYLSSVPTPRAVEDIPLLRSLSR